MHVRLWQYVFGADFYNAATKKLTADSPQNIAALKFEQSFFQPTYNKTAIQKFESGFGKYLSPNNAFFQGKLGMAVDGEWIPTYIKQDAPKLDYGIAPLPYPDGHPEVRNAGWVYPGMLFIPANSPHKQAAWTFIQWLESKGPNVQFCDLAGAIPTTLSALHDPALIKGNPGVAPFVTYVQGKNIKGFPSLTFTQEYITALTTEDQKVLNLEETPQQAMQKALGQVQSLVK